MELEPRAVGCQPMQMSGRREGGGLTDTRSARRADTSGVTMFRKGRTVLAEHKGDSAILETSFTGDNYLTDQPRLKTAC